MDTRKLLATLAFGAMTGLVIWITVMVSSTESFNDQFKHSVTAKTLSNDFPLAVVTTTPKPQVELILYGQLADYKKDHPDTTFVIPDALKKGRADGWNYWHIMSNSQNKQVILTSLRSDEDQVNRGWYEADKNGFKPLFHQNYFGPAASMQQLKDNLRWLLPSFIAGGCLAFLVVHFLNKLISHGVHNESGL